MSVPASMYCRKASRWRFLSTYDASRASALSIAAAPMATNAPTSLLMCESDTTKLTYSFAFCLE
jgi:hypothetical protein